MLNRIKKNDVYDFFWTCFAMYQEESDVACVCVCVCENGVINYLIFCHVLIVTLLYYAL